MKLSASHLRSTKKRVFSAESLGTHLQNAILLALSASHLRSMKIRVFSAESLGSHLQNAIKCVALTKSRNISMGVGMST